MIWDLDKLDLGQAKSGPITAVQYARQLIEDGGAAGLADAANIYKSMLADSALPPASASRAEIESLYGSLLCLQAQNQTDAAQAAQLLETARELLQTALMARDRPPEAWATTSANLALVYINRFTHSGDRTDVLSAHLALDDTLEIFVTAGDQASAAWVRSLRAYLVGLTERRAYRRDRG